MSVDHLGRSAGCAEPAEKSEAVGGAPAQDFSASTDFGQRSRDAVADAGACGLTYALGYGPLGVAVGSQPAPVHAQVTAISVCLTGPEVRSRQLFCSSVTKTCQVSRVRRARYEESFRRARCPWGAYWTLRRVSAKALAASRLGSVLDSNPVGST